MRPSLLKLRRLVAASLSLCEFALISSAVVVSVCTGGLYLKLWRSADDPQDFHVWNRELVKVSLAHLVRAVAATREKCRSPALDWELRSV